MLSHGTVGNRGCFWNCVEAREPARRQSEKRRAGQLPTLDVEYGRWRRTGLVLRGEGSLAQGRPYSGPQ